jgi:hypothetical protein
MQVIDLNESETARSVLYSHHLTTSMDIKDILCSKWTGTLLLGTTQAAAVIVKVVCSFFFL